MKISILAKLLFALLAIASIGVLPGCDSGPGKPESIATNEQVNNVVEARKLYDKASGNWGSLTADEQAQFNKLAGDDAKGKSLWQSMANPMGARTPGG